MRGLSPILIPILLLLLQSSHAAKDVNLQELLMRFYNNPSPSPPSDATLIEISDSVSVEALDLKYTSLFITPINATIYHSIPAPIYDHSLTASHNLRIGWAVVFSGSVAFDNRVPTARDATLKVRKILEEALLGLGINLSSWSGGVTVVLRPITDAPTKYPTQYPTITMPVDSRTGRDNTGEQSNEPTIVRDINNPSPETAPSKSPEQAISFVSASSPVKSPVTAPSIRREPTIVGGVITDPIPTKGGDKDGFPITLVAIIVSVSVVGLAGIALAALLVRRHYTTQHIGCHESLNPSDKKDRVGKYISTNCSDELVDRSSSFLG